MCDKTARRYHLAPTHQTASTTGSRSVSIILNVSIDCLFYVFIYLFDKKNCYLCDDLFYILIIYLLFRDINDYLARFENRASRWSLTKHSSSSHTSHIAQ